jgi:Rrf2 family transcriptional regulator, iron-sulfur cluster assembly transcription factor
MKFSTRVRYGLRAMLELALDEGGGPVPLARLAEKQHLSVKYLENLFQSLRSAKLVVAARGPRGGYRLARPAGEISVLEVAQALDGRIHLVECVANPRFCDEVAHCRTHRLWGELSRVLEARMAGITLDQLAHDQLGARPEALGQDEGGGA